MIKLYLPGGTATITVNNWNSRIEKQIYDTNNMGRWTVACYNISDKGKLYIITGYRVCETKVTEYKIQTQGPNSVWT
jgi:hypothetical protein